MKRIYGVAMVLVAAGCSRSSERVADDFWTGCATEGFPAWVALPEIPAGLRQPRENPPVDPKSDDRDHKAEDARPLCYVRLAALGVSSRCFDAAQGNADFFADRFQKESKVSKERDFSFCGDQEDRFEVIGDIVFRTFQNGPALITSAQIDETERGKAYMYAAKPLQIADDACAILFAMQGVDSWAPMKKAGATWHAAGTAKLAVGRRHCHWATMKGSDAHVLVILRLERVTRGEKWMTGAEIRAFAD